jgi:transcriptional regulator with XRE-family HTH domain
MAQRSLRQRVNSVEEQMTNRAGNDGIDVSVDQLLAEERLIEEAGEMVSRLMERCHVSKAVLAERLGVSKSHISQLLGGARNMTLRTFADLAFALGHRVRVEVCPFDVENHDVDFTWQELLSDESREGGSNKTLSDLVNRQEN